MSEVMMQSTPVAAEPAQEQAPTESAPVERTEPQKTFTMPEQGDAQNGSSQPSDAPETDGKWYWADGVAGEGNKPDWYNEGTFKSIAEQAEGYTKLQSHHNKALGGFTGAPEGDYEYALPDSMTDESYSLNSDDPALKDFSEYARKANINQDAFTQILDMYHTNIHAMNETYSEEIVNGVNEAHDTEMAAFGEHNQQAFYESVSRASSLPGMTEDGMNDILDGITTAQGLKDFMTLVSSTKASSVPKSPGDPTYETKSGLREQLAKMQKMGGPGRDQAEKALIAKYTEMYPGDFKLNR